LLLVHKAPNFIGLNEIAFKATEFCIRHLGAPLASGDKQAHNRVPVHASESFSAADRATLK
jgi:hypothetical protein